MYRKTFANIYLNNLKDNVSKIISNYSGYKYYIGVVKADCYGHIGSNCINAIIDGGCNYLAVSSLDEALEIRKNFDIPILCLGIIHEEYMDICEKNNIDVTVTNLEYLNKIKDFDVNIHIKIDTGMNRLGVKYKDEFNKMIDIINKNKINLKGIFTHIYKANDEDTTSAQINKFKQITSDINLNNIDMIHIAQSDTLVNYSKIPFANGCRLGIIMYGLTNNNLNLKSTFSLVSEIIEIKKIKKGEVVSYDGNYKALCDETIGIVSIGYADGVNRKLTGSYVYINNKKYKIIGNICMDMMMVLIDDSVSIHDVVYIYRDNNHILDQSKYIDTICYELLCNVSKRVPRVYK